MLPRPHRRALLGIAAGATVTALFGAALSTPAVADPVSHNGKIKLPDVSTKSRVVKDRYLVETTGTPLAQGGSTSANQAGIESAKATAKVVGAKVGTSYSQLWTGLVVTATEAQIRQLSLSSNVKAIYPVLKVPMPKTTVSKTKVSSELATVAAEGTDADGSGIKVGLIDTGVDYDNADLGGSGTSGGDTFPTTRVHYGTDFVGDNYDSDGELGSTTPVPDNDPMDCAGHGTHVAGIVGADGDPDSGGAVGVATKVTFGAYKVFGCEGSTDTSVILDAMTKAKADGMDIVNMSLGSDFDSWPSYPDAVAAANLAKAGVVVVAAAGNSGDTGLFSAGSPAVGSGVISVASYESEKIRTKAISVNGVKYPYTPVEGTAAAPADNSSQLALAQPTRSGSLAVTACSADGALDPVATGTALLVKRGDCAFSDKVATAYAAGAAAVVIYNNVPGMDSFTTAPQTYTIPAVSMGGAQGESLAAEIGTGSETMTWMNYQQDLVNPDGGALSTFSSAGLAADLSLVPTITAPGGKIYSTLPLKLGGHGNMSGTSMATPYISGAAALVLQAKPSLKGHPSSVAQLLYNTANPVKKTTETTSSGGSLASRPEAVFRQGSGLVNVAGALSAGVTASPSVLKLGEGSSHKVSITLTNKTSQTLTYKPSRLSGVSAAASTDASKSSVGTTTPLYDFGDVGFTSYSKSVTIKPGKSAKVSVKLTAPTKILKGKAGMLYGGWVQFTTTGAGNAVSVPFAGMRGDYQSVKVLNKFQPVIDSAGNTWKLPALGYVDNLGNLNPYYSGTTRTYTLDPDTSDVPLVLYHLDYPASDVQLKVTDVKHKKSYYAILDYSTLNETNYKISSSSTHLYKQSRDDTLQYTYWDGNIYYKGKAYYLPDGTYTLQLRVLKPLGSSSKSSHWETYTTPKFNVSWFDE